MLSGNLFAQAQPPAEGERFETLLRQRNLQIERIISSTRITPADYQQPQDEWVVLLQGEARLSINGQTQVMRSGDYLFLPAGTPHRVEQVSEPALWLAIHLHPEPG